MILRFIVELYAIAGMLYIAVIVGTVIGFGVLGVIERLKKRHVNNPWAWIDRNGTFHPDRLDCEHGACPVCNRAHAAPPPPPASALRRFIYFR